MSRTSDGITTAQTISSAADYLESSSTLTNRQSYENPVRPGVSIRPWQMMIIVENNGENLRQKMPKSWTLKCNLRRNFFAKHSS